MRKKIFLVRHCQATGQAPEAGLTAGGAEQAQQLAQFFEEMEIAHIISSPFTRAIHSIEPAASKLGLQIEIDSRLSERVLSPEDLPDWMERLEESFGNLDLKLMGGESGNEAMARGMEVVAAAPDRSILVSHGNLLGLLLKKMDTRYGFKEWKELSNPDVYEIDMEEGSVKRIWA
ncbi:phosphoglycerate mutase GpmB [Planococcus massiliensis]|uniref:Phosphoglycerate mutase GpmB n=1 Tax=Planococcus massiliensis TaxID=1499687 RepID=A0A098EKS1_9BACL|nr:histidine phosphatase family protein [Planococcus massiliensis]CEG21681.1 phosphoglycerate mutase GpmB [Planococcus massiliensis]